MAQIGREDRHNPSSLILVRQTGGRVIESLAINRALAEFRNSSSRTSRGMCVQLSPANGLNAFS